MLFFKKYSILEYGLLVQCTIVSGIEDEKGLMLESHFESVAPAEGFWYVYTGN